MKMIFWMLFFGLENSVFSEKYDSVDEVLVPLYKAEQKHLSALQFGYPVDTFGRLFPSFSITGEPAYGYYDYNCPIDLNYYNSYNKDCKRAIRATHGILSIEELDAFKKDPKNMPYFPKRQPSKFSQSWDKSLLRIEKVYLPVYQQDELKRNHPNEAHAPGLLNKMRATTFRMRANTCGTTLANWQLGNIVQYGCGYSRFLHEMFWKAHWVEPSGNYLKPDSDASSTSAIFWYFFCKYTWPAAVEISKSKILPYTHPWCPNPCARFNNPCIAKEHVVRLSGSNLDDQYNSSNSDRVHGLQLCQPTGSGVYDHEFKCICQRGYMWSKQTQSCVLQDGCRDSETNANPCFAKGTSRCISMVTNLPEGERTNGMQLPYTCICHPSFMGTQCDIPRDACLESTDSSQMSGNQACRIFLDNRCIPRIGTNIYSCECGITMEQNPAFKFPNCFKQKSSCSKIVCRKGKCVSSKDKQNFVCLCQMGWYGPTCNLPDVRNWMPWQNWQACSAEVCTGLGWRARFRTCRINVTGMADKGLCQDEDNSELELCQAMCPDIAEPYKYLAKIVLLFGLACLILVLVLSLLFARARVEQI